jgi:hypothetical protein
MPRRAIPIEEVPETDCLFVYLAPEEHQNGKVAGTAFDDPNQSAVWCKYDGPHQAIALVVRRSGRRIKEIYGATVEERLARGCHVACVTVAFCRSLGMQVVHSPLRDANGHAEIVGPKEGLLLAFADHARLVYNPTDAEINGGFREAENCSQPGCRQRRHARR